MTTRDTTTEGIVLTEADLDTAREFIDRAIINATTLVFGDSARWPQTTADATGLGVNVGHLVELARLDAIHTRLVETSGGVPYKPLTGEMVAAIRRAADHAISYESYDDGSDPDWTRALNRDANLARATLAALDNAEAPA